MTATRDGPRTGQPFRHEALFYADADEFVAGTSSYIRDGLERGEAVLAVLSVAKIDRLRGTLGRDAPRVEFADMADVGRNPALIIQSWRDFADRRASGQVIRGIGEPVSPERSEAALAECHIHESLLNVAFEHDNDFWLLCPYDTAALPAPVLERAVANHPFRWDQHGRVVSHAHTHGPGFDQPLPAARVPVESVTFDRPTLRRLRAFVVEAATRAGVDEHRARDLSVASCEIATNSIVHGGGPGEASAWIDGDSFVSEIRGVGRISDPLAGRLRPEPGRTGGYGLWLANQFCDLVQIRSSEAGTVVRLHVPIG